MPTALMSSVGFMVLETYVGFRFLQWRFWRSSCAGVQVAAQSTTNVLMARAGSLLLLDALTIVPNAFATNQLAQFIPFSIGALIVIGEICPPHC